MPALDHLASLFYTDLAELGPAVQRLVRDGIEYWGAGPDYHLRPGDDGLR